MQISSYHAPGKYILNSGIEKGSFVGAPVPIVGRPLASTSSAKETEEEHSSDMFKEVNVMERKCPEELGNKISSHQSDSFCEKEVSPLVIDSGMHDLKENLGDLPIISDTKVPTPEASNSSSSSEDGSESESESDSASESGSSGSGTASSASESGSGSGRERRRGRIRSFLDEHATRSELPFMCSIGLMIRSGGGERRRRSSQAPRITHLSVSLWRSVRLSSVFCRHLFMSSFI